jgi:predicted ATP-grasp superfamily ATP-dependent carboligase
MFFLGLEPNLKWRTFSRIVSDLAQEYRVKSVIHIGALLDAVPHSREIRLTGSSTAIDLQEVLDTSRVSTSRYQGPTGITSAISEACTNQGMEYASLWGHTSHYLQAAPNYRVSHTLADALTRLLDLPLDLGELATAASTFDDEVEEAIAKDDQLQKYVKKLEDRYDESVAASEMPDPADVVQDLERFLRSEQRSNPGDND